MCGIVGIFSSVQHPIALIRSMLEAQAYRGPDDEGFLYCSEEKLLLNPVVPILQGKWALGHKRLCILDLSKKGAQPMAYHRQRLWLVFNGEIYNYKELREILHGKGYAFSSQSDTEVILASYLEWGTACFEKFNGMWALALIDIEKNALILSRDRFGEKPLYYYRTSNTLFISSEIKGILAGAFSSHMAEANKKSIAEYLVYGAVNHTLETFFKDIFVFPAANYAKISLDRPTEFSVHPYWQLNTVSSIEIPFKAAQDKFQELLSNSIKFRLRSDVRIGSCLSGGLDSSSIVGLMQQFSTEGSLHTFTSITNDPLSCEKKWAKMMSEKVKSIPHYIEPTVDGFLADLDALLWHQEEPFTSTSIYAQWLLMKAANKEGITVLLDGQGADEILAGYRKFYYFYLRHFFKQKAYGKFFAEIFWLIKNGDRGFFNLQEGKRYLPCSIKKFLFSDETILNQDYLNTSLDLSFCQNVREKQREDIVHTSLPSLLRYEDKNAMAWSIETRVPFLDHKLVEFLFSLPTPYLLYNGRTKHLLRQALKGHVPDQILQRRDKKGFATAQKHWMQGKLKQEIAQYFEEKGKTILGPMIKHDQYRRALKHNRYASTLLRTYILGKWLERFNLRLSF